MRDIDEFKAALAIDRYSLDTCITEQVILFSEVSEETVDALARRDTAKKHMEEMYADVSLRIRQEAVDEGKKMTEGLVKENVLVSVDYIEAQDAYFEIKNQADHWSALKEAFMQRSYMIREMGALYVAGYFAEITVKGPDTEEAVLKQARERAKEARRPIPERKRNRLKPRKSKK